MTLLSALEFASYCPDSELSGTSLDAAIMASQSLMESPLGAGRSLEVTQYVEVLTLPMNSRLLLSYASELVPLIEGSVSLQLRGGDLSVFGLTLSSNLWRDISSSSYTIDYDRAEIVFQGFASGILYSGYGNSFYPFGGRSRRPTMKPSQTQARIVYSAGFDPDDTSNKELLKLKQSIAYMAQLRGGNQTFSSGIKSAELSDFYKTEYGLESGLTASTQDSSGKVQSLSLSDELLMLAKRYRPRSFAAR